ncbi:MAG: SIS domain-containing protein [Chlamydiales bacterium]|nr:SIS domain-containing protein [Chlamydiales bacterium]
MLEQEILFSTLEAVKAAQKLTEEKAITFIHEVAEAIVRCYQMGGKLLIAGNGGSLCDAMHFAEELTGFYRAKRKALPAIALADPSHISCVGNDVGFEFVFSRYVEALGKKEDILICLTTSGNSKNIIYAVQSAQKQQIKTVAFLGKQGGSLKGVCDLEWIVDGFVNSDRIQEAHMAAIHIIIEMVEKKLFPQQEPLIYSSHVSAKNS